MYFKSLPLCLLLLIADISPSSASFFPRAIERAHSVAVKHSRGLARDLRVAFGGVSVTAVPAGRGLKKRSIYCSAGPKPAGSSGNGNSTSGSSHGQSASGTKTATKTTTSGGPTSTPLPPSPWKLNQSYQGANFYNGWDFFVGGDPTGGIVQYVDQNTGQASGLVEVNAQGNAVMRVETTPTVPQTRQSIRITTQSSFTGGLVIMESVHIPTGCGTWPAFWSNGPNWPATGEIDIVEGVGDYTNNQATIHTNPGCSIASTSPSLLQISGTVVGGTDCAAVSTGNQGCGIRAGSNNSFGAAFNNNGGGVYAMQWDTSGIAVYFFPNGTTPPDITAEVPQPSTWGTAMARWPAANCNPFEFFNSHSLIFDTTLCGDWASGVWTSSGIPGQEQSCAQRTGFSTCEAFVRASGSSLTEAYWEVKSVKIYQMQS